MTKVNGPFNAVRLEGVVNNVKKVIYLFMDVHVGTTQCEDVTFDFRYYLSQTLKKTNNVIDFFLEIQQFDLGENNVAYQTSKKFQSRRSIYLDDLRIFFVKKFHTKKQHATSGDTKNISTGPAHRFHYIDIRDIFYWYALDEKLNELYDSVAHDSYTLNPQQHTPQLIYQVYDMHNILHDIMFKKNYKITSKKTNDPNFDNNIQIFKKYTDKILLKYENKNINKSITNYAETIIKSGFDTLFKIYGDLFKIIKDPIISPPAGDIRIAEYKYSKSHVYGYATPQLDKKLFEIKQLVGNLQLESTALFAKYMDLYFLRRILDKKYVTHSVVYTGSFHSIFYIKALVQDFNFKITNTSFNSIGNSNDDIIKLNKNVKAASSEFEIEELFFPEQLYQCSDLTDFPDNFD